MSISSLPYPSIQQQRTGGQSIPTPSDKLRIAQLNSPLTLAEKLINLLNQKKQNSSSITQEIKEIISMIKGLLENFEKQRDESSITIPTKTSEKYAELSEKCAELQRQLKEFQNLPDQ